MRNETDSDFKCQIFQDGELTKACRIRVSNSIGLNSIAYSEARGNMARYEMGGINELASVGELDGHPALEFTMSFLMSSGSRIITVRDASERFWTLFTSDFNQDMTW